MSETWYHKTTQQIETILKTNAASGLSRKAARVRLRKDGPNEIYKIPRSKTLTFVGQFALDFTSLLLLLTAGIAWLFDQWQNAAVLLCVWLINFFVAALTYAKSQQIFSAMYAYSIPEVYVLREGRLSLIDSRSIVCGDVIFLREGDVVPADARIVSSQGLMVVEADTTGILIPVNKNSEDENGVLQSLAEQKNMVFASSTVVMGGGRAIVVATGEDTQIFRQKGAIPLESHSDFALIKQVKKYCRTHGLFMIALVFAIAALDLLLSMRGGGLFSVLMMALCLAAASMSELLGVLAYITIARGIAGAALVPQGDGDGAIIKNIAKLEQLSTLDCLMVDSGSIYDRTRSEVVGLYAAGQVFELPDLDSKIKESVSATFLLKDALTVSGSLYSRTAIEQNSSSGDYSDGDALVSLSQLAGIDFVTTAQERPLLDRRENVGGSLFKTVLIGSDGEHTAVVKGEVQEVLSRCVDFCGEEGITALDAVAQERIFRMAKSLFDKGCRVYAVARSHTDYNNLRRAGAIQSEMTFVGLVAMREELNPGASEFIEACRRAQIRLIMLHDGSTEDLERLAAGCGFSKMADGDFSVYSTMQNTGTVAMAATSFDLFAGLDSKERLSLLDALKKSGFNVGVLSCRFADLRLLHMADASFTSSPVEYRTKKARETKLSHNTSRSSAGCQALKRFTDVLTTASPMSCIKAIKYAKSIYHNFKSAANYLITIQLARMFLVICSVLTGIESITATGILVSGLVFDFAAVMVFAFERPLPLNDDTTSGSETAKGHQADEKWRLSPLSLSVVLIPLFWSVILMVLPVILRVTGLYTDENAVRSYALVSLLLTQLALILRNKRGWRNEQNKLQIGPMMAGYIAVTAVFIISIIMFPKYGALFGFYGMTISTFALSLCPPILMIAAFVIFKNLNNRKN